MRELDRIRHALAGTHARGESVMLATVMGVDGSVYRGAGARMLVLPNGAAIGAVSGGCLEADVVARSTDVIAGGRAELVQYDTRASDDVVLGLGLGCQGVIDLLLEPLAHEQLHSTIALFDFLSRQREDVTLLTYVGAGVTAPDIPTSSQRVDTPLSPSLGARVVLDASGHVIFGDATLLAHAEQCMREVVKPAIPLLICGGGADAIPVARLAKEMGWHVTVVDHRPVFANAERFPDADAVACLNVSDDASLLAKRVVLDDHTVGVVMAHSASHDRAYLGALLDAGARYVGVLGPRRRTLELLGDRVDAGSTQLPPAVHSPVGLDLGAESPEEIALAIVAEIAAAIRGRAGGFLRDRSGPLHYRSDPRWGVIAAEPASRTLTRR